MHDVIVIGAGISGLAAARRVKQQHPEAKVLVLEARDRVGGRTCTVETSHGTFCDVGGAYVGPNQNRLLKMAADYNIETYKVYNSGKVAFEHPFTQKILMGTSDLPPLSALELLDFNAVMVAFDKLVNTTIPDTENYSKAPDADALDKMTVQQWVEKNAQTELVRVFFPKIVDTLMCKPATEVSMLNYLWYTKSAESFKRAIEIENGAQERKFVGGSMGISVAIARELGDDIVLLEHPVSSIKNEGDRVVITTANSKTFTSKAVIVSVPPSMYDKIQWSPPLPKEKVALNSSMTMGSIIKTTLYYERAWWREGETNGQCFSTKGPIIYSIDDTKPDGSYPALMGFLLSTDTREWAGKTEKERKEGIAQQYYRIFKNEEALKPIAYVEKNWDEEEWSGGCYVASFKVGSECHIKSNDLRTTIYQNKVHFAGTETATEWSGYIDGGIQAGERAGNEVLNSLFDKNLPLIEDPPCSKIVVPRPAHVTMFEVLLAIVFNAGVSVARFFSFI